eukprot:SAG11_NODE_855_length_6868_cov_3.086128_6_plen_369_part_00
MPPTADTRIDAAVAAFVLEMAHERQDGGFVACWQTFAPVAAAQLPAILVVLHRLIRSRPAQPLNPTPGRDSALRALCALAAPSRAGATAVLMAAAGRNHAMELETSAKANFAAAMKAREEAAAAAEAAQVRALAEEVAASEALEAGIQDKAMPEGTLVRVEGREGVGVYKSFKKKTLGANEHMLVFDGGPVVAVKLKGVGITVLPRAAEPEPEHEPTTDEHSSASGAAEVAVELETAAEEAVPEGAAPLLWTVLGIAADAEAHLVSRRHAVRALVKIVTQREAVMELLTHEGAAARGAASPRAALSESEATALVCLHEDTCAHLPSWLCHVCLSSVCVSLGLADGIAGATCRVKRRWRARNAQRCCAH